MYTLFLFFLASTCASTIHLQNTINHHILNKHSHIISINTLNPTIVHQCILDSLIHREFSHVLVVSQNTFQSKLIFQQLTPPHQTSLLFNIKYSHNLFVSNIVKPTSLLFIENINHHNHYQHFFNYKKIILLDHSYPNEIYVLNKHTRQPQIPP